MGSNTNIKQMNFKYDLFTTQEMSASFHPLQALASSQPPPASSAAHSVDQQLHEWGQALWLDFEAADPFRKDWALQQEGDAVMSLPDEKHGGNFALRIVENPVRKDWTPEQEGASAHGGARPRE
jgi:hypothetical protein